MTTVSVNGGSNGAIAAATLSGGSGSFTTTYLWASGTTSVVTQNVLTQSNLKAGNYTLTVYDTVGASRSYVYAVPQNAVISIGGSITNVTVNAASTGSIKFGDPALLQRYSFDGSLTGDGSLNLALQNTASTLGTPTYAAGPVANTQSLVVPAGKYLQLPYATSLDFKNTVPFSMGGWSLISASASSNAHVMSNLSASSTNGIDWYTWSNGTNVASYVNNSLIGGDYALSSNAYGRWVHFWMTYDGSNMRMYESGTLKATGALTSDFSSASPWTLCICMKTSAQTLTGRVSDVRFYTGVVTPTVAMAAIPAATPITGGTGTYTSSIWSSSAGATQNLPANMSDKTALKAGTYSVLVTDSATATASKSYTLTENAVITTTRGTVTNVVINGGSTGAISSTIASGGTGSYTYTWSGTTTSTLTQNASAQSGLKAGTYTVVVGDSAGAPTVTQVYTVTQNPVITITPGAITHVSINGQSTGQINTTIVNGGSSSFVSYIWTATNGGTPGQAATLAPRTLLHAGTYTLVVTDSVGGTATYVYTVTENPVLTLTLTSINHANDAGLGSITATAGGGTNVYTYSWTSTGTTATPITTSTANATGLDAGTYTLTLIDSAGATVAKSTTILRRQTITFPTTTDASTFGTSSSTSGLYTVFGSPDSASGAGAAYIYVSNGTTWSLQQRLVPSDPVSNAKFGFSVSISGDYCIVGSYNNNCAYVFIRSGTTWTQQAKITSTDSVSGDQFGFSVAIDDVYCCVGANLVGAQDTGALYIFKRTFTSWAPVEKRVASDASTNDRLGSAIAMSGLTIVAGAAGWDQKSPSVIDSGAAYVFCSSDNGVTWPQQSRLVASVPQASSGFGTAVAIDRDYAVVGSSTVGTTGAIYVFTRSGITWAQQSVILPTD
jgi:FG-GAP repeat/Concanavalin A-like lectin/glucanases superfamily